MERHTGGCLCGNVRFVAVGSPYRVGVCHCLDCRKHHGALFSASSISNINCSPLYVEVDIVLSAPWVR